ncbi:MAG TPA: UDP-N-acetylmuramate--L-alanine ligase [Bacteroidales bacterium]|nr:UDP-N-acetylmuramate--L-alanine ligase [Bacteroidales bacterium]
MDLNAVKRAYLIGIGGIGMSAIARYYLHYGIPVAGYDRISSDITLNLEAAGANIHYTDSVEAIPPAFLNKEETLVIYTPAIPASHGELEYFRRNGFVLMKRAQALGLLSSSYKTIAVAGTHGKTTTSTLLAHLLATSMGCDAFLGGISRNYSSNLILADQGKQLLVVEADEYDRSFLTLHPYLAIVTSIDADHLDIYGTYDAVLNAFQEFVSLIKPGGYLVVKQNIAFKPNVAKGVEVTTYGFTPDCHYYPTNISIHDGLYRFTLVTPRGSINDLALGVPGYYNLENAIAASAAALTLGVSADKLAHGLESFRGVQRRFDVRYRGTKIIYIDDYAHHPSEIEALVRSVREVFPHRKITGIFQPHLYSRTHDFAAEFAAALDKLDRPIITEIYPARELPIEGVTSETIVKLMSNGNAQVVPKADLISWLNCNNVEILLTIGAGDIDRMIKDIVKTLEVKENKQKNE